MKHPRASRNFALCAVFLLILPLPAAASNDAVSGLRLEAKELDRPRKRIVITLGDPSGSASHIVVNVYFIGRAPNNGPRFIYADAEILMNLHGLPSATANVDVAELHHDRIKRSPPKGMVFTEIGDAEGWIVVGVSDGKVFRVRASSAALLAVGESRSSDSPKAMIADYRHRQKNSTSR